LLAKQNQIAVSDIDELNCQQRLQSKSSQIQFVLLWIALCLVGFAFSKFCLKRCPVTKAYSLWCATYAAIKTFPIALSFSPTLCIAGWFVFPAPAGLVLIYCMLAMLDPALRFDNNPPVRNNLGGAVIAFTLVWFISWLVALIRLSRGMQTASKVWREGATRKVVLLVGLASILQAVKIYYFGFRYAHPPSGVPLYQGP
jgi:hypothetical protein